MIKKTLALFAATLLSATTMNAQDVTVTPGGTPNTWWFLMPAYDVEVETEFCPEVSNIVPPTAVTLPATGEPQALINTTGAGATGGTLYYALGTADAAPTEPSAWSTSAPTGTDEGTYYVWYKVIGDADHCDCVASVPQKITTASSITAPAMALVTPPTPVDAELAYTGTAQTLFNEGTATGGTLKYKVTTTNEKPTDTSDFTTSIDQGTNAGTYYLWYYIDGGGSSTDVNDDPVVKAISKAMPEYTAPTAASGLVYDALAHELITAGSTSDGTMEYSLTQGEWTTDATTITGKDAAIYIVYYRLKGDENHMDVPSTPMPVVIDRRDISKTEGYTDNKYVTITTTDQTWTGTYIDVKNVYTIVLDTDPSTAPYTLTTIDYVTVVIPEAVLEPGSYSITFVGQGNFIGSVVKTFNVLKDISTELTVDVPTQLRPQTGGVVPVITVTDGNYTLEPDVDYTWKYYESDPDNAYDKSATEVTDPSALVQGKYWVTVTGKAPKYKGSVDKAFYVVNEYQTLAGTTTNPELALHVDADNPGSPDNSPKGSIKVGATTGAAVDVAAKTLVIPGTFSVQVADKTIEFNVTEIESGAFEGTSLHYIDATAMADYTPSSLDREAPGAPFKGLPKQTLVFLGSLNLGGENYIYKLGTDDYRCNILKIYDDVNSAQTGFDNIKAAQWDFMNPYEFKSDYVVNTRLLNADKNSKQQGYTTCLPYALPVSDAFKAYIPEASKEGMIGFAEVTGTLEAMSPYLLLPSTSGELLSAENVTVVKTYDASTLAFEAPASLVKTSAAASGQTKYTLTGTVQYLTGATTMYILQSNNEWKKIESESNWPGPCVLPMRAYLVASGAAPSRIYSSFTSVIDGMVIDADDQGDIYDLQGRKVKRPQRGGIYIMNGQKFRQK